MLVDKGHVLHAEWVKQDIERNARQALLVQEALRNQPANQPLARLGRVLIAAGERLQGEHERAIASNGITELLESKPARTTR